MVTMLIRCRVADYDHWRRGYEAAIARDVEARIDPASVQLDFLDEAGVLR